MEQKNKKLVAIIGIFVAALLVVGVAGAMNAKKIANVVKEKTSTPEEYYRYVEEKNRDASLNQMKDSYGTFYDNATKQEKAQKATYQIELGDTLKALASGYGLESASIVATGKAADNVVTGQAKIQLNGKDAASFNTYLDYDAKEGYIQIPELSASYLDMSSTLKEAAVSMPSYTMGANADQYLLKADQINTLVTSYSDIILDNTKKVDRSREELTVGDISEEYTKLVVTCDGEDVQKMSKEILEKMKDDTIVKEVIEKVDKTAYSSFQEQITKTLEELEKAETDNFQYEMVVYVDDDADIVGRIITLKDDKESYVIKALQPCKDNKTAYEVVFTADDTDYLTITGNTEEKNNKLSGDFSLSMDESLNPGNGTVLSMTDVAKISVKDLDQKAFEKDGSLKGIIELSSDQIQSIAGYTLRINMDNTKDQSNNKIEILVGSDVFVTIQVTTEEAEDPGVTKPAEGVTTYDLSDEMALSTYVSEMDWVTFLTDLKTNCGVDLTALMGMME